jgi:hypothetical protein
MPNLEQIHALIKHYGHGPSVFFHPDEVYLPSSVSRFFKNGALLYRAGDLSGEPIDAGGTNFPGGGKNDGHFGETCLPMTEDILSNRATWNVLNFTSMRSLALVGTFTDLAMWVFYPFNGPIEYCSRQNWAACRRWGAFHSRVCNFTGQLWNSGGESVEAYDLEYIAGNRATVYSSKSGHASFPHSGCYIQGSPKLRTGIRNDAARSSLYVDSSIHYENIAAEYLQELS